MVKDKSDWIEDGEKFALIGMRLDSDRGLRRLCLPGYLSVLTDAEFELPDFWREWLGTARVENVKECNLFLLAKMPSKTLSVLDNENQILERRTHTFFLGLILASKFTAFERPILATGSRVAGEIDIRSFGEMDRPLGSIVHDETPIGESQLRQAAEIAGSLQSFDGSWKPDHWRFFRCHSIYHCARANRDMLDRIHQFTRCIEGLIASKQGETKRKFKSRTEIFIGSNFHDLMGELYEVRSDIEHLHENKYLEARDRATSVRLAELEAISEWIARSCITRILLDSRLLGHFGSVAALEQFWVLPEGERRAIWGAPVDPNAPLKDFNFGYVSDDELGVGAS
jgi:hypothetical protein